MKKIKTLELKGGIEVPVKHTSEMLTIGWKDGLKALLIAIGTPILNYLIQAFQSEGSITVDWKKILTLGSAAGLIYLTKNFFTPSQVVIDKDNLKQ